KDNARIRSLCREPSTTRHWQGKFVRFPNSVRKASFADHRRYLYQGKVISQAVHMGVDLASVSNSPVPAANTGRVLFAGRIGIYGRTVILDHGLGLYSLYAHLSQIDVKSGEMVDKNDIIGRSGMTGLAGGDHLHYGMLVNQTFVNPVEWWDATWIENNITTKIKTARQMQQDGAWSSGGFR
ncbi:MAG: M23 family metallopeptidase, partial [Desulfosudaceae bacterium]